MELVGFVGLAKLKMNCMRKRNQTADKENKVGHIWTSYPDFYLVVMGCHHGHTSIYCVAKCTSLLRLVKYDFIEIN